MELNALQKKCRLLKSAITKFETYVEGSSHDLTQLKDRLDTITTKFTEFENTILNLQVLDDENTSVYDAEYDKYENIFIICRSKAKDLIAQIERVPSTPNSEANSQGSSTAKSIISSRLPPIELPKFGGNYSEWLAFADLFKAVVDGEEALNNAQKFHYLKSCLTGEAAAVIHSLGLAGDNYELAWDLLKERYDNPLNIIRAHVDAIFNLEPVQRDCAKALRRLFDEFKINYRALANLKEPTEHWDILLIHILSRKLGAKTREEWERSCLSRNEYTLAKFLEFLNQKCKVLEKMQSSYSAGSGIPARVPSQARPKHVLNNHVQSSYGKSCFCCNGPHLVYNCRQFLDLSVEDRIQKAKEHKMCLKCLRSQHSVNACKLSGCRKCGKSHNTLLHLPIQTSFVGPEANIEAPQCEQVPVVTHASSLLPPSVLLGTALVKVQDRNGRLHNARALLDNGSQCNLVTTAFINKLKATTWETSVAISGIGHKVTKIQNQAELQIIAANNIHELKLQCLVMPNITTPMPCENFDPAFLRIPKNIQLADPQFYIANEIDILIGAGCFWDLLLIGQISLGKNQPVAHKTKLGWIISGQMRMPLGKTVKCCSVRTLEDQVRKFWEIEEIGETKPLTADGRKCEEHFIATHSRNSSGRFIVRLPLKESRQNLGDSRQLAVKRFYAIERRFRSNPQLKTRYQQFVNEYLSLGHMCLSPSRTPREVEYFLPHHAVLNNTSLTTKLRVVFDGSAKTSTGKSLNDIQAVGPVIQDDLFSILLRFRKHAVVLTADITKMYRQVLVHDEDTPLQEILWRDNLNQPLREYVLKTVTYGTASASFLAIRCLQEIAKINASKFPIASEKILSDFYVDDLITGTNTIDEAVQLQNQITEILADGGFPITKWMSNNEFVLKQIPAHQNPVPLSFDEAGEHKTLGLQWHPKEDILTYKIISEDEIKKPVTKRSILSHTAQIFDPLGLVSPSVINAKLIIQRLWEHKLDWDESIPDILYSEWTQFTREIPALNNLAIKRHVLPINSTEIELHSFSDASEKAYGACVYIRAVDSNNKISVNLLCSKSRVAPLKNISLPRLELCGALLSCRLVHLCKRALMLNITKCQYWTDSTIVLAWIRTQSKQLKTFIANRVAEIQTSSDTENWNHVSGKENPADLISRGTSVQNLINSNFWWHGPAWLTLPIIPIQCVPRSEFVIPELKLSSNLISSCTHNSIFTRYSALEKLQRVVAYMYRFLNNCGKPKVTKILGPLTTEELRNALRKLIILGQYEMFPNEVRSLRSNKPLNSNSKLLSLRPMLIDSVIRVGGRLCTAKIDYAKKHPAILGKNHPLTNLIIGHYHVKLMHAGPSYLLAMLREEYWPINGMSSVKRSIYKCVRCFKTNPKFKIPQMGQLPAERVTPSRPFMNSGVDYAGPILIKDRSTRGPKLIKAYICLFVCLSTKAIHLELVETLTTEAFIAAFRRFISRRGMCTNVFSDNGTNFRGASTELKELSALLKNENHQKSMVNAFNTQNIQWHFIPPRSPHMGGLWEAGVKSVKQHLRRVLGNARLTYEQFYTILTQVEACLNSRPLYPISDDPTDLSALTPGHFLIGEPLTALPDVTYTGTPESKLSHFQRCQQLMEHFWIRWHREYITSLQQLPKWKKHNGANTIKTGSLVIIKEDNIAPLHWRMARITALHPGKDGIVRVISAKTSNGEVKRPISKIALLPID